jgi:hypothetical protein
VYSRDMDLSKIGRYIVTLARLGDSSTTVPEGNDIFGKLMVLMEDQFV